MQVRRLQSGIQPHWLPLHLQVMPQSYSLHRMEKFICRSGRAAYSAGSTTRITWVPPATMKTPLLYCLQEPPTADCRIFAQEYFFSRLPLQSSLLPIIFVRAPAHISTTSPSTEPVSCGHLPGRLL